MIIDLRELPHLVLRENFREIEINMKKWFGLNGEEDFRYETIVSCKDRALEEHEFISEPMMFREYQKNEQDNIIDSVNNFYSKYILNSKEIYILNNDKFIFKNIADIKTQKNNFLHEKDLKTYYNDKYNYIISTDYYIEIFIYSHTKINFKNIGILKARSTNHKIKWAETPWGDEGPWSHIT